MTRFPSPRIVLGNVLGRLRQNYAITKRCPKHTLCKWWLPRPRTLRVELCNVCNSREILPRILCDLLREGAENKTSRIVCVNCFFLQGGQIIRSAILGIPANLFWKDDTWISASVVLDQIFVKGLGNLKGNGFGVFCGEALSHSSATIIETKSSARPSVR